MTDDAIRCLPLTPEQRAENVALTVQAERRPVLAQLATHRRLRTAKGATLSELGLYAELEDALTSQAAQIEQLLDERDNHRFSRADPRLWQLHQLAREASRTDSTGKAVREARDELLKLALSLFPLEAPDA